MSNHATTIVRGPSVQDLIRSVQCTILKAGAGIMGAYNPAGRYPILWSGPVRVTGDCRKVWARCQAHEAAVAAATRCGLVVWAFPDGEGAEARLYGRLAARDESAQELDDVELPLDLDTAVVCMTLEIPTHGISMMARVPETFSCFEKPATNLTSARSLQENIADCMMAAGRSH
jgi:hypothetical protein